jgi:serine/threonine protein kinase, bacterial
VTGSTGALLAAALSLGLAPTAAAYPPDADSHGFVGYPGGRCAGADNALAIGRTAQSLAVICQDSSGAMYYMGYGLENGLPVRVDRVLRYFSAGYTVNNVDAQYTVTPQMFEVDGAHSVLSREQWIEYWPSY